MSRTEWAIDQICCDYNAGRITHDERAQLIRAVTEAASAGRSVSAVLDEHAKMRSR